MAPTDPKITFFALTKAEHAHFQELKAIEAEAMAEIDAEWEVERKQPVVQSRPRPAAAGQIGRKVRLA